MNDSLHNGVASLKRFGGSTLVLSDEWHGQPAGATVWKVLVESEQKPDGNWEHSCHSSVLTVVVHHSIHDGPFLLSGSGRVHIEQVPYCPSCETVPSPYGRPIRADW